MYKFLLFSLICYTQWSCFDPTRIDNFSTTQEASTTIEAANIVEQLISDLNFAGFDNFDFTQNQEFTNRKIPKNHIEWIHPTRLTLTITDTSQGQNFDFLKKIEFYVEGDNQPTILLAKLDTILPKSTVLSLKITPKVDLKPYAVLAKMSIKTHVEGKKPTLKTEITAKLSCDVEAQL